MELLDIEEGACLENQSSEIGTVACRDKVSCSYIKTG